MQNVTELNNLGDISHMDNRCEDNYAINDLIRRVEATYRIRINAAIRLRKIYNHNKKLNIYYSALVTGVSIVTIGFNIKFLSIDVSNIVLMISIVLSYFAFYISEQNLQERAYRMEETYRELDKLRNKLVIYFDFNDKDNCNEEFCKKMYKQYEQIISNIENHENIDYKKYLITQYEKKKNNEKDSDIYINLRKEIIRYERIENFIIFLKYIIPVIVMIIIFWFHE